MDGMRLKKIRNDNKLTQKQLSEILSITSETLSKYELNKSEPSDSIKVAIANYFDISLDYLLGAIDEPYPLNRVSLSLPIGASDYNVKEINEFVKYLSYKNTTSDEQKELVDKWSDLKADQKQMILQLINDLRRQ